MSQRLLRLAERLIASCIPGAAILLYHRVTELVSDPQLLAVRPRHFEQHLEILRREFHPMSLTGLVEALARKRLPERVVVVTMDDGYADNFYEAKPLLQRFDIPATVFVTAGQIGSRREFWWDDLERIFFHSGALPEALSLNIGGDNIQLDLGGSARYGSERYEHDRWNVETHENPTERHAAYRTLVHRLRSLPPSTRQEILDEIVSWSRTVGEGRATHRALTADELLGLVQGGLVEVGAHSVTHPVLAALAEPEQKVEVEECKWRLEEILGSPVRHFAYPFGSRTDFTRRITNIVERAGFLTGCANYPGIVRNGRNRYRWPRILVRDWDGDEFRRRLRALDWG